MMMGRSPVLGRFQGVLQGTIRNQIFVSIMLHQTTGGQPARGLELALHSPMFFVRRREPRF